MEARRREQRFALGTLEFYLGLREEDYPLYVGRYNGSGWHESAVTEVFSMACGNAACILDIGAHIGWYSLIAAKLAPHSSVFAFEPDTANARALKANLALAGASNVVIVPLAVSDAHRQGAILGAGNSSLEFQLTEGDPGVFVDTVSIDDWCGQSDVTPDLIKIDVEGHEEQVLQGMHLTLTRCAPVLLVEVHSAALMSRCIAWLGCRGYNTDAVRLAEGAEGWCNTILVASRVGTGSVATP